MKTTLAWLKTHLDTSASLDEIVKRLVMLGIEVEGVENRAKDLSGFVIGHVVEAKQHPNADRLRLLQVDTGKGVVEVASRIEMGLQPAQREFHRPSPVSSEGMSSGKKP